MRIALALAVLIAPLSAAAQQQAPRSYAGTVGTSRIVLTLEDGGDGPDVRGSYFYLSTRLDIALHGQRRGGALILDAMATSDHLELRPQGQELVGTLTTAAKRRLAVRLSPVTHAANLPADVPTGLSLHEQLQLAGLTLAPDGVEQINGRAVRWYREAKSGVRLFRLEGDYAAEPMRAMNAALARNQWQEVTRWLGCVYSGGTPGVDGGVSGKPWLGRDYVSYAWQASWSCAGAAHPDFGTEGHSFDARTGRELTLDEVLRVPGTPAPTAESDAWYRFRSDVFAPHVVKLLQRYHPAEMRAPGAGRGDETDEPPCDYTDPTVWSFPAWRLSSDGLWLGASFARVMRVCDTPEWAVLPWSALPPRSAE